uniref:Secreted protein n=1 Tax=Cynoglossus semilaevis TaxID=244447 RepID=A0A3P8V4T9_CYNSE
LKTPCLYAALLMHLVSTAAIVHLDTLLSITCAHHQAAGQRQLCSLKGKVNSCAGDSWSAHDILSPNIRDGLGRNVTTCNNVC